MSKGKRDIVVDVDYIKRRFPGFVPADGDKLYCEYTYI